MLGGLTSGAVPWWHGVCPVLPKLVAEPAGSSCRVSGSKGHVRQRRWRIWLESRQRKTSEWLRTSFEPARAGQWFGQSRAFCRQVGLEDLPLLPATTSSLQCSRRGPNVALESAYLTLSLLQDSAWKAAEQLNIDDIDTDSDPFRPILKLYETGSGPRCPPGHRIFSSSAVNVPARFELSSWI